MSLPVFVKYHTALLSRLAVRLTRCWHRLFAIGCQHRACFTPRQQTGSLGTVCSLSPIKDVRRGRLAGEPVGLMMLDKHWFRSLMRLWISFPITTRGRLRGHGNLDTIKICWCRTETWCPMAMCYFNKRAVFWVSVLVFGGEGTHTKHISLKHEVPAIRAS